MGKAEFELQLKGDQEIQRKLDDIAKKFKDIEKSATDLKKGLDDGAKGFDSLNQSADETKDKLGGIKDGISNVKDEFSGTKTEIDNAKDSFENLNTAADSSQSSLDQFNTTITDVKSGVSDAQSTISDAVNTIQEVDPAAQDAKGGLDAVKTAFEGVNTSAQEADQNIKQAVTGIEGLGTATPEAENAMKGLGSAFEGAGTQSKSFNDVLTSTGTAAQGATGGLTSLNTIVGNTGQTTQSAASGFQGLNQNVGLFVGFAGNAAGAGLQFAQALNSINDSQLRVETLSIRASNAVERESKARDNLNQLLQSGTASTQEIAQAQQDLTQLSDAAAVAVDRHANAQEDLNRKIASFAVNTLPNVITSVTSTIAAVSQLQAAFPNLASSMSGVFSGIATAFKDLPGTFNSFINLFRPLEQGLVTATEGMTKTAAAANLLRTAIAGITFTGFLAIVTAISTALVLLATNTGGSRDAMNEYGKAIGKAVPQAKPLLDFFGQAIEGLGQLMGVQSEADKAMIKWATTVAEQAKHAQEALESPFEFMQSFTDSLKELQTLESLDKIFGGAGFGEFLALMGQIRGEFENGAESGNRFKDILEPVAESLRHMGKNIETVGGESLVRYNAAVTFANQLMQKWKNEGVQPSVHELSTLQRMIANIGDTVNTQYVDPIEAAMQGTEGLSEAEKELIQAFEEGQKTTDSYVQILEDFGSGQENARTQLQDTNTELQTEITSLQSIVGSWENYNNAILESGKATADHNVAIDKLNTLLGTSGGQIQSYNEAVAAGNEEFLQWNQTTRQAAISNQQLEANLKSQADTLGGLPSIMEPTIENYQAFIRAQTEGGDAAKAFEKTLIESWSNLTAEAEPLFDDLKEGWRDVFSGTSAQEVQTNIQEISQTFTDEMTKLQKELGEVMSAPEFDQARYQEILGQMDQLYRTQISDMAEATSTEFTDPVMAAFAKLPPAVAATLDETERATLAFQAQFSVVAEQAGQAWADNLRANMGLPDMVQKANESAQQILAPFIAEHPELQEMFRPLFDQMNQMGPSSVTDIHAMLQNFAKVPGDIGVVAQSMLTEMETKFSDELAPSMKSGTEVALEALAGTFEGNISRLIESMTTLFEGLTGDINKLIKEIKQDPADIPIITANANPANAEIQGIGTSLTGLKEYLGREENKITISAKQENPLEGQISGAINSASTLNEQLASTPVTLVGAQTNPLEGQISGAINSASTLNQQLASTPVTLVGAQTNPLAGQITLAVGAPELVNQNLTANTITMVASNENPLAGQIRLATEAPGQVNQNLQQNTITMVASNENPIAAQISGVISSVQELQRWLAANPISLGTSGAYAGAGGGAGAGIGARAGLGFARGFGPAFVTRPTRMLVGEAGPELVSVIPLKNRGRLITPKRTKTPPVNITAQGGLGGGAGSYGAGDPYGGFQDATAQGTEQGMDQSMGGMQDAVSQGVQDGMQQGGYPMAPSNTELFGAGRFSWSPGGMGGAGGEGAQYPVAPSNTELFGTGTRFTWGGGRAGPQLGGMGGGGGAQYPVAPSNTELFGTGTRFTWTGGKMGTSLGAGASKGFVKAFETGMKNQSQLINGVPATILTGNQNPGSQAGFQAGQSVGQSFGQGFRQGAGEIMRPEGQVSLGPGYNPFSPPFPASMSSIGTPKGGVMTQPQNVPAYTGKVPASYGQPLGQTINGVRATILPGMRTGASGIGNLPELQSGFYGTQWGSASAQGGMHRRLRRNTMIAAHRGERVDIGRGGGQISDKMLANLMRLMTKLAKIQSDFEINFNVDGAKLGHVTNKNMGKYGYGDRGG